MLKGECRDYVGSDRRQNLCGRDEKKSGKSLLEVRVWNQDWVTLAISRRYVTESFPL